MSRRYSQKSNDLGNLGKSVEDKNPGIFKKLQSLLFKNNTVTPNPKKAQYASDLAKKIDLKKKENKDNNIVFSIKKDTQKKPQNVTKPIIKKITVKKDQSNNTNLRVNTQPSEKLTNNDQLINYFDKIDFKSDGLNQKPLMLSSSTKEQLKKWNSCFNEYVENQSDENKEFLDIVIGYDFGTSSSKIIISFPYFSNLDSFAFPVPKEFRVNDHEHCWQTMLYFNNDTGIFEISPSSLNVENINQIKTRLMQFDKKHSVVFRDGDNQMTIEYITTIYLSLMIRNIKGWILSDILSKYLKNYKSYNIQWNFNFGVPAASLDKKSNYFKNIFSLSCRLSETTKDITPSNFISLSNESSSKNQISNAFPEVVAQSIGFIEATKSDYGAYVMVDIGASTLDICIFNINPNAYRSKTSLFTASVKLLGAETINWIKEVNTKFDKSFSQNDLKKEIQKAFNDALIFTKKERAATLKEWKSSFPIILSGGGKYSNLHASTIKNTKEWWKNYVSCNLIFPEIVMPENVKINCSKKEYHRLSVAYGLSFENQHLLEYELPSDIENLPQLKKKDIEDNYIGPEQI